MDGTDAPDVGGELVERNIEALLRRRREAARGRGRQDRLADAITDLTGSMRFVYIHLVLFGSS